jgi:hypothetical protein
MSVDDSNLAVNANVGVEGEEFAAAVDCYAGVADEQKNGSRASNDTDYNNEEWSYDKWEESAAVAENADAGGGVDYDKVVVEEEPDSEFTPFDDHESDFRKAALLEIDVAGLKAEMLQIEEWKLEELVIYFLSSICCFL